MEQTFWLAIAFLVVIVVLAWRFNAVEFTMKALGFEGTAKASRTEDRIEDTRQASNSNDGVQATGDGAVAIGEGAENADIETNVRKANQPTAQTKSGLAGTTAAGDGAVAVHGGVKGARITTNVEKKDDRS